jgi:hypothetical protein
MSARQQKSPKSHKLQKSSGTSTPEQRKLTYPLRDIPRDVWKRAQLRALHEGYAVRHVLLASLEHYAAGGAIETQVLDKYRAETDRLKRREK